MIDCKKIKDIREDNDVTQEQMAKILGVKRSAYSLWELGINIIPLEYLCKFSSYFNLTIDYVLGINNNRNISSSKKELDLKILGNNLKKIRLDNKLYQKDIANFLNVSRSCVAEYESGKVCITISNLYKISKKYKITIEDLCFKENN